MWLSYKYLQRAGGKKKNKTNPDQHIEKCLHGFKGFDTIFKRLIVFLRCDTFFFLEGMLCFGKLKGDYLSNLANWGY